MKCKIALGLGLAFLLSTPSFSQTAPAKTILTQDADPLVEVITQISDVKLDVRYATVDNFLKAAVYPVARVFLHQSTCDKLKIAQEEFKKLGYLIKIFDGYRPLSIQKKMWAIKPDARYVANPKTGSMHNRGGAIDLTLVTLDGQDVPMPTPFDDFSIKAHHGAAGIPPEAAKNAVLLKSVMENAGFKSIATEWWHYQDPKIHAFPVLDIPIESVK